MKKCILFDVDGVLIHGYHVNPDLRQCWDETIEEDLGINRDAFEKGFIFKVFRSDVITGKRDLKDALEEFLPTIGFTGRAQTLIDYWLSKDSKINHDLFQYIKILKEHPDVRLFIATNQEHHRARYLMEELGFSEYFEDIFHSAKIGASKSEDAYYTRVTNLLGTPENPPIFFDDTPQVIEKANANGWIAYEFHGCNTLNDNDFVQHIIQPQQGK